MKKKITLIACLLAAAMMLSGCKESILTSSNNSSASSSAVNIWTANDEDIVASAQGEKLTDELKKYYEVNFKDFYSEYSFAMDNYGIDETSSDYIAAAEYYRQSVIEMLTNEKIILKKAEELGLDKLTQEEEDAINKKYEEDLTSWYPKFKDKASASFANTSDITDEALLEKEKELFSKYLADYNFTEETFLKWERNTAIEKKVMEYLCKDVTVSEAEIKEYVDNKTKTAKETFEKNMAQYEANSDLKNYWVPDGAREIKYIYMSIGTADIAEIMSARTESDADNAAIDKRRDEKLAEIKAKAEEALAKCTAEGADFNAVRKEYSNDYQEGSDAPALIIKETTSLSKELYDAIFALEKEGDVSGLVATDRGYYILKYVNEAKITDENKKVNELNAELVIRQSKNNEVSDKAVNEWIAEVNYSYDYEKLNFPDPATKTESSDASSTSAN